MLITAHAGADHTPANSLDSLRHLCQTPADCFEVDVRRRTDGVLILSHDPDPTGQYFAAPTLASALELAAARPALGINMDLKEPGLEPAVRALTQAQQTENPLYLSGSVSPAWYAADEAHRQAFTLLINAEEIVPDFYPRMLAGEAVACAEQAAAVCLQYGISVVNVFYWCCPDPFLQTLRAHGLDASVWTVDEPDEARHFVARDVCNLTTHIPARLVPLLRGAPSSP